MSLYRKLVKRNLLYRDHDKYISCYGYRSGLGSIKNSVIHALGKAHDDVVKARNMFFHIFWNQLDKKLNPAPEDDTVYTVFSYESDSNDYKGIKIAIQKYYSDIIIYVLYHDSDHDHMSFKRSKKVTKKISNDVIYLLNKAAIAQRELQDEIDNLLEQL